jgi:hypothetical protein
MIDGYKGIVYTKGDTCIIEMAMPNHEGAYSLQSMIAGNSYQYEGNYQDE